MSLHDDLILVENKVACPTLGLGGENSSWRLKTKKQKGGLCSCCSDSVNLTSRPALCWGKKHGPTQEATRFKTILKETKLEALPQGHPPRIAQLGDGQRLADTREPHTSS